MARKSKKWLARENYELFDSFRSERRNWAYEVSRDTAYYLGKQWSAEEEQDLLKRGKAPLVMNIIRPHIDGKKGIIAANTPKFKCLPRGDEDTGVSKVFDNVMDYIWYISSGRMQMLQTIHEYCVGGLGYMQADIDPFADYNRGEVVVRYIPYNYVYPDPTTRRMDFSDSRRIFLSMRIPRETGVMMYPDQKVKIMKAPSDSESDYPASGLYGNSGIITPEDYEYTDSSTRDYIRIIERYELGYYDFYAVHLPDKPNPIYVEASEYNKAEYVGASADQLLLKRCRRITSIADSVLISDEIMPIDDFPIVPFVNVHTNTPYPHGDVRDLRDPQDEKNKRRMVIIHHAMAAGTNRTIAPEGTVDIPLWERKVSIPGSVLTYSMLPGGQTPQPFPSEQLPNAFFHMEEKSERDIDFISGIHPSMLGDPVNAPDTYRATLMLEESGTRRIRGNDMSVIEHGLSRLGRVVLQLAQYHYRLEKVMRIIGEDNDMVRFVVNKPEYDEKTGRVTRTINDLSIGQFDVICIAGSTLPTNKMAEEQKYHEMYQMNLVDRELAIRKSDIADPDALIARFGEIAQLQGALEQSSEENKSLAGILQTLKRQLVQQEIKMSAKEFELLRQAELIVIQAQGKIAKALMGARSDVFSKRLSDLEKIAAHDMKTKLGAATEVQKARSGDKEGSE